MSKNVNWGEEFGTGHIVCVCDKCGKKYSYKFTNKHVNYVECQKVIKSKGWYAKKENDKWLDFCCEKCKSAFEGKEIAAKPPVEKNEKKENKEIFEYLKVKYDNQTKIICLEQNVKVELLKKVKEELKEATVAKNAIETAIDTVFSKHNIKYHFVKVTKSIEL